MYKAERNSHNQKLNGVLLGKVYLSLEPSFSISSCSGANSRLSIKLNSWQEKASQELNTLLKEPLENTRLQVQPAHMHWEPAA